MSQPLAVIPTIGHSPLLRRLVDQLREEEVEVLLIVNNANPGEFLVHGDIELHFPKWKGIYKQWNLGMAIGAYHDRPTLILNDDVILAPGAATLVADELRRGEWAVIGFDYAQVVNPPTPQVKSVIGTYRHGGVGGFAFGVNPNLCTRVDDRFMWWGGDDDLVLGTAAAGRKVGVMYGAQVFHPEPSRTANAYPELLPEGWVENDRNLLIEKWGGAW